jgi:hypothetical protein
MFRGIDIVNGPTRKDFLAFFGKRIETFVVPTTIRYDQNPGRKHVSSELPIEIEAQKLHQVKEALEDAEKLGEEDLLNNGTEFAQTNEKISAEISEALPTAVILALIEDYYQGYSNTLTKIGQEQRKVIRRTLEVALAVLALSFLLLIGDSILTFLSYQILSIPVFILGAICGVLGLVLLKVNLSQRKDLGKTIEKQDLLDRLKVTQLLINQITDEKMKNEAVKNFLASILK